MALNIKHQSTRTEKSNSGITYQETYYGTAEEVNTKVTACPVGTAVSGKGTVKSIFIYADPGQAVWNAEYRYSIGTGDTSVTRPSDDFGTKSCTCRGTMLSVPLENSRTNFRAKWNHYFFSKDGSTPTWYNTAQLTDLTLAESAKYKWGGSVSDQPQGWTSKAPTKPGVQNYSVPSYSITERAKYASASAAGNAVKNKLGKIGTPAETFGISTGDRNWLCEDATIEWTGKYWVATLSWTLSGDDNGWDPDLYTTGS